MHSLENVDNIRNAYTLVSLIRARGGALLLNQILWLAGQVKSPKRAIVIFRPASVLCGLEDLLSCSDEEDWVSGGCGALS